MRKIKLGIIGCGTIGTEIALQVKRKLSERITVKAIFDTDKKALSALKKRLRKDVVVDDVPLRASQKRPGFLAHRFRKRT